MKVFKLVWGLVLGFFVTLLSSYIMQKVCIYFSIPYLMDLEFNIFLGINLFVGILFLVNYMFVQMHLIAESLIEKTYEGDKIDEYKNVWAIARPFIQGFILICTWGVIYLYYLILI